MFGAIGKSRVGVLVRRIEESHVTHVFLRMGEIGNNFIFRRNSYWEKGPDMKQDYLANYVPGTYGLKTQVEVISLGSISFFEAGRILERDG
jgi:hypothetical protein